MNKLKAYTFTVVFSAFAFAPESRAATIAPPLSAQVQEVVGWFTGEFNNAEQVDRNPSVPLITMSNCTAQLVGDNITDTTETVYLEQSIGGFPFRVRFYSFGEGDSTVTLGTRRFVNETPLLGLCDRPESDRAIDFANIVPQSCNLDLNWLPDRYIGTNAPVGCPASFPIARVVSDIVIQ